MGYRTATLNTYKLGDQRVGWVGYNKVERSSAQQAYVIKRDNDFATDDKLGQVVQVAQRLVFQNPSPEIHRCMQLPVDSFQFHRSGSLVHLALADYFRGRFAYFSPGRLSVFARAGGRGRI
jgi:hypothetical protein